MQAPVVVTAQRVDVAPLVVVDAGQLKSRTSAPLRQPRGFEGPVPVGMYGGERPPLTKGPDVEEAFAPQAAVEQQSGRPSDAKMELAALELATLSDGEGTRAILASYYSLSSAGS